MDPVTAGVVITVIAALAVFSWWMSTQSGLWLMRRHIGTTCPVCEGMGSTETHEVCRACHGKRYIWGPRE